MKNPYKEKILVTGCAGFIGMHICKELLNDGHLILGIDNLNNYYDQSLKLNRLKILQGYENFYFEKLDITNFTKLNDYIKINNPVKIVNLAAQAGVRYSVENPHDYIDTNIAGFMNILECCRHNNVESLIYASSSSVYGGNTKTPFSESDNVDNPISIYAVSKLTNELMAKSYYNLFGLKSTGLRFFTVYGPWGRPDMAYFLFTKKIFEDKKIKLFNSGNMFRDFTYVDDIILGLKAAIIKNYDCEVFNLGNNKPEKVLKIINIIESKLNKKAIFSLRPMQLGEVDQTFADIEKAKRMLNFKPQTDIEDGINSFIKWYKDYICNLTE